jgi:uncharacterized protein YjdB
MPRRACGAILLAALVGVAACGDDGPTGPVPVATVLVTPSPAILPVGEALLLSATTQDQAGNTLTGRTVTWTSANASIATVTSGNLIGIAEGTTTVAAVSEGAVGSVPVTVSPARVASVDVRPTNASVLLGETLQMTATPRSSAGTPLVGRSVTWSTSDPLVATVSASGLVEGVSGGPVTITATVELQAGATEVEIVDPTAPRLSAITPFPMIEGEPATITGQNFGATAGENAVTVDGVAAVVTAADGTSLTFTVPDTGCRPLRDVPVRVTADGKSGSRIHPLRPAAFTQVGVGEQVVLTGLAPCLQFDASNAFETYLFGVHSTTESASSLHPARVTGRTGSTGGPAPVSMPPGTLGATDSGAFSPVPGWLRPTALPVGTAPTEPTAWDASERALLSTHAERHLGARRDEAVALRTVRPDFSLAASGALQSTIPPGAQVGQTFSVRVPPHFPGSCSSFNEITAELRLVTARGYWLVDQTNLAGGFSDADLAQIAAAFEDDVAPVLEATFGPIPDTDGDGRIAFVSTARVNQEGWLSYASLFDYRPRTECAASNEGDWAYLATPQTNTSFTRTFLLAVLPHSLAHDFTHVIQNRAVIAGGVRADAWIEEGQATLGEEVFAHSLSGRSSGQNYGASVIFSSIGSVQPYSMVAGLALYYGYEGSDAPKIPNAPEQCSWLLPLPGGSPPGPCDSSAAFSGSWAFLRWLTDHFADAVGGEGALHQALIDASGPGFERVAGLAGLPIETLLARFGASLYVDDRVDLSDALLGLPSWNLFDFHESVVPQAQLQPRNVGYQSFTHDVSVRGGSTAYFRISGPGRPATAIDFTGAAGGALSPDVRVWIVRLE